VIKKNLKGEAAAVAVARASSIALNIHLCEKV